MTRTRNGWRVAALGLMAGALLAACGGEDDPGAATSSGAASSELTVHAAASLKASFTDLAAAFEDQHAGTTVLLNFAGSSDLVAQLGEGAPGDVLATADTRTMDAATADDLTSGEAAVFATNSMIIAVPPGNPAGIEDLDDLTEEEVRLVLCAPEVPCGAAAGRIEEAAGIDLQPVSEESSVADVMGKVTSGEADAGIVYVTDVKAAGDKVESIEIPTDVNTTTSYPIATLAGAEQAELAQAFVDLVLGAESQAVLEEFGFVVP